MIKLKLSYAIRDIVRGESGRGRLLCSSKTERGEMVGVCDRGSKPKGEG